MSRSLTFFVFSFTIGFFIFITTILMLHKTGEPVTTVKPLLSAIVTAPVQSQAVTITPLQTSPQMPIQTSEVNFWPPSRVDAKQIPLTFEFTSSQVTKIIVSLEYKMQGMALSKKASMSGDVVFNANQGANVFSIVWNKQSDTSPPNPIVDLKLTVTDEAGKPYTYDMKNINLSSRETIRNRIEDYLIYYGKWSDEQIDDVKGKYQLVIVDVQNGITQQQIAALRAGNDPHDARDDVLVLGYLSLGEDSRTANLTPAEMKLDSRFVGDRTGPSIDPRAGAPFPDGSSIPKGININGKPTNGGFAPYYLNDNFIADQIGQAGIPDINANFKAAFVNPGHPEWLEVLTNMRLKQDKVAGIKELLTSNFGAGYGCDGLFFDTLDTAAPNFFTSPSDSNPSEYEWVAVGTQQLIKKIREAYPSHFLLANRGLFFYNPDLAMFPYTVRGSIDFLLFESFRLNSNLTNNLDKSTFYDNKYNYAQKVLAEADRSDGFRVLSLGYAEGDNGDQLKKALHGEDRIGKQALLDDIYEAYEELGMIHYLSNGKVDDINTFTKDNKAKESKAPTWGSTRNFLFGEPIVSRIGIQKVEVRGKDVFVQWDVAHSQARPISYTLYIKQGTKFDFSGDLTKQSTQVTSLPLNMPANYIGKGDRTLRYAYEAKVEGLVKGKDYYLLIQAKNTAGLVEQNRNHLKVTAP